MAQLTGLEVRAALVRVERLLARWSARDTSGDVTTGDDSDVPELPGITRAREIYGLSPLDCDALLLALAVELDPALARMLFTFSAPRNAFTVAALMELLAADMANDPTGIAERLAETAPLRRFALLELENGRPFSQREVICPEVVWRRMIGHELDGPASPAPCRVGLGSLVLSDTLRTAAERAIRLLRSGETRIVVRGRPGSGRTALACAIADGAGLASLVFLDRPTPPSVMTRDALWHRAAVICHADSARDLAITTPVIVIADRDTPDLPCLGHEVVVTRATASERAAIWRAMLPSDSHAVDEIALAERYKFGPGRIEMAISRAAADARADRAPLETVSLDRVCRSMSSASFGGLAQRMACPYDLDDIVVPRATRQELELAIAWASHGHHVSAMFHDIRGIACLFHGPPGTGKTMAAQIVARRLQRDLYRVDLSQVVNKYVGETEKNLASVFEEAARSDVVLLFDEAESLFGARTEHKDAHDRYANLETGFLLQRLEQHEGLVILATNLRQNLDSAFSRRLQVVAAFPLPGPSEQKLIWDRRLPAQRDSDIDLDLVANRFRMSGGDIRNAALTACVLAISESTPVAMRHVVSGVTRELRKAGRLVDPRTSGVGDRSPSTYGAHHERLARRIPRHRGVPAGS